MTGIKQLAISHTTLATQSGHTCTDAQRLAHAVLEGAAVIQKLVGTLKDAKEELFSIAEDEPNHVRETAESCDEVLSDPAVTKWVQEGLNEQPKRSL